MTETGGSLFTWPRGVPFLLAISMVNPPEWPDTRHVSHDYPDVMGIDVVAGRCFDEGDGPGQQVLLINRTLERSGLVGPDPVGRPLLVDRAVREHVVRLRDPLIFPYSKAGRLLHNVGRPICHQAAAPLEQIGPRVTPLDVGSNGVRQGVFAHRVRVVSLFARPRAERRAEPVDGRCPFQAGEFKTAQQDMSDSCLPAFRDGKTNASSEPRFRPARMAQAASDSGTRCSRFRLHPIGWNTPLARLKVNLAPPYAPRLTGPHTSQYQEPETRLHDGRAADIGCNLAQRIGHAIRGEKGKGEVLITVDDASLDRRSSLAVRNHSPTGPAWAYGGSGPAQLAPGVLLSVTNAATAERFYQRFKWIVSAPIEAARWTLDAGDILGWLESAVGTTLCAWRWRSGERAAAAGCVSAGGVSGGSGDGGG